MTRPSAMIRKALRFLPALAWASLIWAASSTTWTSLGTDVGSWLVLPEGLPLDKIVHLGLFGVLAALIAGPLAPRWRDAGLAWIASAGWGALDELHQLYVPGRDGDPLDWIADATGAALALALLTAWRRVMWPLARSVAEQAPRS